MLAIPPRERSKIFQQSAFVLGPFLFGEPMTEAFLKRAASLSLRARRATGGGLVPAVRFVQRALLIQRKHLFFNSEQLAVRNIADGRVHPLNQHPPVTQ